MKVRGLIPLLAGGLMAGCETGGPINSSYDPLDAAGGTGAPMNVVQSGYRPGEFVEAVMDKTAFFEERPQGEAKASRLLAAGTTMKVISDDPSFVKVELDSGDVGFVSSVQIAPEGEVEKPEPSEWPPVDPGLPLDTGADPDAPVVPVDVTPDEPAEAPTVPGLSEGPAVPETPSLPAPVE
jgi:hypothetical protein